MLPDADYEVGYKKPPKHTRFKKGHSGNPRGRPSGVKNLATIVGEALDEKVVVTENGRRRKVTKREAIVAQVVNHSAQGDFKATQILLGIIQRIEGRGEPASPDDFPFGEEDHEILARIKARVAGGA